MLFSSSILSSSRLNASRPKVLRCLSCTGHLCGRGVGGLLGWSLAGLTATAMAGTIPYANVGTIAPEVPVFASSNGGVDVFYFGSGANFYDSVEVADLKTGYDSGPILGNHSTALGAEVSVGTEAGQINAGDQLVFYIDSPAGKFASLAADSQDGVNHAYITSYAGGPLGGVAIPSGLYVGMEDQTSFFSDFDYNDDSFVFAGVSAPSLPSAAAPEPSTLALLGTGLVGAAGAVRRRVTGR